MGECPNIECQKRQDGHHTTLYGKEGTGGLVACVQKMVSRSFLMWCAVILIGLGGIAYKAYSQGQKQLKEQFADKYCPWGKYHEVNSEIIKLRSDLEHVKKTTDDLKTNSNEVLRILNELKLRGGDAGDD